MNVDRPDSLMMCRCEVLCKVIYQVVVIWHPHYLVYAKIDLVDQQKILAVHCSRALSFYHTIAYPACIIIIDGDFCWALLLAKPL